MSGRFSWIKRGHVDAVLAQAAQATVHSILLTCILHPELVNMCGHHVVARRARVVIAGDFHALFVNSLGAVGHFKHSTLAQAFTAADEVGQETSTVRTKSIL
jgi:hypothetical protein